MNSTVKILAALFLSIGLLSGFFIIRAQDEAEEPSSVAVVQVSDNKADVRLETSNVVDELTRPWDIAFTADGEMLFTERGGTLTRFSGGTKYEISGLPDINVGGEGGLLGLVSDPNIEENGYIYACYNTDADIRVSRWILRDDELLDRTDIVTGMPINTASYPNRHSGCRLAFDQEEVLWIGTGDVAESVHPQDPQSLGGKILRVDRNGRAVEGNLGAPFDERIYSYGHRNVQGLALTRQGESFLGFSVQHGPSIDDEVNALVPGNFGWDPGPNYDENVPMTDLEKFPDAVEAMWSSGDPTLAPSGATLVYGDEWGDLSGNLFVAMQKTMHIRMFTVSQDGTLSDEQELFKDEYGRIRTVVQAPDGSVYFATDNGDGEDRIVEIIPTN